MSQSITDQARAFDKPIKADLDELFAKFAAKMVAAERAKIAGELEKIATFTGAGKYGIVDRDEYRGYIKHLRGEK